MNSKFKFWIYKNYLYFILAIVLLSILAVFIFWEYVSGIEILFTVFGGIFSFIYFTQKQQLEELQIFREMFVDFNRRYDEMNEELNYIRKKYEKQDIDQDLDKTDVDVLYNYFNLCGEEYLFYQKGYIYPEVWKSWHNGMRIFYKNPHIKKLWDKELETGSYYGLQMKD